MFALKLASDNAVLYGNIVPSTKKQYSIFFVKMAFAFQKITFNVKECSTFPVIVTQKHANHSNGGLFLLIRRTHALSVYFKMKPLRKRTFPC